MRNFGRYFMWPPFPGEESWLSAKGAA